MPDIAERRAKRIVDVQYLRQARALRELRALEQRKWDIAHRVRELKSSFATSNLLNQRFSEVSLRHIAAAERALEDVTVAIDQGRLACHRLALAVQIAERLHLRAQHLAWTQAEQRRNALAIQLHVIRPAASST